jgi:hypothetical protein
MSNSLEKGEYPLEFTIGPLETGMPMNLISFVLGKPDHYKRRCLKIIVYPVCAEYVSQTFYSVMLTKWSLLGYYVIVVMPGPTKSIKQKQTKKKLTLLSPIGTFQPSLRCHQEVTFP